MHACCSYLTRTNFTSTVIIKDSTGVLLISLSYSSRWKPERERERGRVQYWETSNPISWTGNLASLEFTQTANVWILPWNIITPVNCLRIRRERYNMWSRRSSHPSCLRLVLSRATGAGTWIGGVLATSIIWFVLPSMHQSHACPRPVTCMHCRKGYESNTLC